MRLRVIDVHPLLQHIGTESMLAWRHVQQIAVHQGVQLRLEQINHPGQGQQDHERCDEQAGIEMPAPCKVVEGDV